MTTLALIPARAGSKSISDKNILPLAGRPMLCHSIEHALNSTEIDRVIVSTDSPEYASIATDAGAECPFLRPPEFSGDHSTDLEVFRHALKWLEINEGWCPEFVVHLRPTHPIRHPEDIDIMVRRLRDTPEADSIRSLSPAPHTPYKMWLKNPDGSLRPVAACDIPEAYNQPRQTLPETFVQNASIDVVRSRTILGKNSMTGDVILGFEMDHFFDIDTEDEFNRAKLVMEAASFHETPRRLVVDIDGVLASIVPGNDYTRSTPLKDNIRAINSLHSKGHRVILFTARGYVTKKDWQSTTEAQLKNWGVKYHELYFGKPNADLYIDDKLISITEIRKLTNL